MEPQVFKPTDFRLIRKDRPRYNTRPNSGVDIPYSMLDRQTVGYPTGDRIAVGYGCYRSRPTTPTRTWN